jgi:hypothetical protein
MDKMDKNAAPKRFRVREGCALSYGNKLYFEGNFVPLKPKEEAELEAVVEVVAEVTPSV